MTPSKEIMEYYDSTSNRKTRDYLRLAVKLVDGPRVAIDCGCGAGSDIAFLRSNGFLVHAFDIEPESIARCQVRWTWRPGIELFLSITTGCNSVH